jgi:dienelactone hydrolase
MRFLWTMRPVGAGARRVLRFAAPRTGSSRVLLALVGRGRTLAHATLARRFAPDTVRVRRLTLHEDGLVGHLLTPPGAARRPAAVLFGGSEGGERAIGQATMLAAHGYPTLSLAYFKEPGLPRYLKDVPLEYFARAVRLLRRQPDVDSAHVITIGRSRGGEASLLVASTYPHLVHGAVGLVPSANANGSYGAPHPGRAWTYHRRPVPETQIPVEKITGPVLVAGGGLDAIWDSATAVQLIDQRLTDERFRYPHPAVTYANAGHAIGTAIPYLPQRVNQHSYGGDPRADAAARANLWPRILHLLANLEARRDA